MHRTTTPPMRTRLLIVCLASVLAVMGSVGGGALADTRKELEAAQHRSERMAELIAEEQQIVSRVRDKMNTLAGKIESATSELQAAVTETRRARAHVRRVRERLLRLQERLETRVADAFMAGVPNAVNYLLAAASVSEMGDRLMYVQSVVEGDLVISDRVELERVALAAVREELAAVMLRRQAIVGRLDEHRAELDRRLAEQERHIGRLAKLRGEAEEEVGQLTVKIRGELLARGGDGVLGPLYVCPVTGPVAYGDTFGIIHHHPGWTHKHMGNDVMAQMGAPVIAPFDGYAVNGAQKNAGIYVTVRGAEGDAVMMHLMRLGKLGTVEEGDVVGYVGTTGNATSPHVHFEWRPGGGTAVDPYHQLNEVC